MYLKTTRDWGGGVRFDKETKKCGFNFQDRNFYFGTQKTAVLPSEILENICSPPQLFICQ